RTQSLVAKKEDISENRATRNFDLMITQKMFDHSRSSLGLHVNDVWTKQFKPRSSCQDAPFLNVQMMSDHNSSDLAPQCQMMSAENNTSGPAPFLNDKMTSVHISSGLVLHQMTSDYNRSELGIQDHSNEPSSSKLVPKVVPLANKTATSRQELELLFHLHIGNAGRTTG
ncbi:hypothetical protein Tco_0873408, partial [Tanacetum coccineum]